MTTRAHHSCATGSHMAQLVALVTLLVALLVALLPGCGTRGEVDALADLPTLDEVRPRVAPIEPPEVEPRATGPWIEAWLEQLELSRDMPTDALWAHVDEDVLPESLRDAWRANGLRVGVLRVEAREAFTEALPEAVMAVRRNRIATRGEPLPLRDGPRLREPVTIHTPAQRNAATHAPTMNSHQAQRGRMRLLSRFTTAQGGSVRVEIVPQHHRRRASIRPRDPREAMLDGEIFTPLAIAQTLGPQEILVIGLHQPWPEPSATDGDDDHDHDHDDARQQADDRDADDTREDAADDGDGDGDDRRSRTIEVRPGWAGDGDDDAPLTPAQRRAARREAYGEPPELPNHFGRALLTHDRPEYPTQVLMLLSIPVQTPHADRVPR